MCVSESLLCRGNFYSLWICTTTMVYGMQTANLCSNVPATASLARIMSFCYVNLKVDESSIITDILASTEIVIPPPPIPPK